MARDDVNIKVSANVAEAVRLWQAMEEGPKGMAEALQDTGRKGRQSTKGIGEELDRVIGKWASFATAITVVREGLQKMEEDAQKAADSVLSSIGAMGELQQVSRTPEEFARNLGFARSLVSRGLTTDQGVAADITGQFLNAELTPEEMGFFADIGQSRLVKAEDLGNFVESLRKYQNTFGDREAGSLQEITNKLLQAGEVAQTKIQNIATAVTQFGGEAQRMGISDEEAIGAFLAIERRSPNEDIAATRMRSLLNQIEKAGIMRGTLGETLDDIQGRIAGGERIFDILQETRAVAGFQDIMALRSFAQQQQALLGTAFQRNLVGGRMGLLGTDPQLSAAQTKLEAEGQLANMQAFLLSEKESLIDAHLAEIKTQNMQRFGGGFLSGAANLGAATAMGVVDMFQMEQAAIESMARDTSGSVSPSLKKRAQEFLDIRIRLTGPDGRDIPHEVEATQLGQ